MLLVAVSERLHVLLFMTHLGSFFPTPALFRSSDFSALSAPFSAPLMLRSNVLLLCSQICVNMSLVRYPSAVLPGTVILTVATQDMHQIA